MKAGNSDMEHFILAPSGAHRWMSCPGSLLFDYTVKEEEREEAKEGTLAHEAAAYYLNLGRDVVEGVEIEGKAVINREMAGYVQQYIGYCKSLKGDFTLVEAKLDLNNAYGLTSLQKGILVSLGLSADPSGTADFISFNIENGALDVVDLKYGRGVEVFAENNEQGGIYCCGAVGKIIETLGLDIIDIKKIRFIVFQPRIKKKPDVWEMNAEKLITFRNEVRTAAGMAMAVLSDILYAKQSSGATDLQKKLKDYFKPSDENCCFCLGKGRCKAQEKYMEKALGVTVTGGETAVKDAFDNVGNLSNGDLSIRLPALDMMTKYIKALWSEAHSRMMNGIRIPGFKLVSGKKGNRYWIDEKKSENELKRMKFKIEEMYDLKLKSPARIEKECDRKRSKIKWRKLQEYIDRKDSSLTIVPEDDPRPDMTPVEVEVNFDDVRVIEESGMATKEAFDSLDSDIPQIETEETAKETGEKSFEEQMNELFNN